MTRQVAAHSLIAARFKSLVGRNRWALASVAKHPLAAARFEFRESRDFLRFLAWEAAGRSLGRTLRRSPPASDSAAVSSLQSYLLRRGREWPLWDRSHMVNFKGPLLYFLARLATPHVVVETGVAAGVSSSFLLQAIQENGQGRLVSIDLPGGDPEAITAERPFGWIVPEALRPRWTLVLDDVRSVLTGVLARSPGLGLVVHDDMKAADHRRWEFQTSWMALAPGGLLVSDDVELNDAFFEFCRLQKVRGFDAYDMGIVRKPG